MTVDGREIVRDLVTWPTRLESFHTGASQSRYVSSWVWNFSRATRFSPPLEALFIPPGPADFQKQMFLSLPTVQPTGPCSGLKDGIVGKMSTPSPGLVFRELMFGAKISWKSGEDLDADENRCFLRLWYDVTHETTDALLSHDFTCVIHSWWWWKVVLSC